MNMISMNRLKILSCSKFIHFVKMMFNAFYNFMNRLFRCWFGNKDYFYTMITEMYRSMRNMKSQKWLRMCLMLQKVQVNRFYCSAMFVFDIILIFQVAKTRENYYYKNISWPLFYKSLSRVRINNWNLVSSKNILWTIFTWSDK